MDPIIREVVLTLKDVVVILGFPVTIVGVALALQQLKRTVAWNKLNATFALFGNKQYSECQEPVATEFARLKIEFYSRVDRLTADEIKMIVDDTKAYGALKSFLNYLEDYSTALNVGVLEKETAFQLMGDVLTRYFDVFEPLILQRRVLMKQPALWCEWEKASEIFNEQLKKRAKEQADDDDKKKKQRLDKITAKEIYAPEKNRR